MEIRHDEYNMINDNIPEAPVNQTIIGLAGNPNTGKAPIQLSDWIKTAYRKLAWEDCSKC